MEVKCEYCGSMIPDDAKSCPNCGAPNVNMNRAASNTPRTIAELEQWYKDRNLPPYEKTRFFIGINCKEPKAFGIYQEGETFTVYKNKADGTRAIRYKGTDEDYAVNELYLKLKSEILNQKELQLARNGKLRMADSPDRKTDAGGTGKSGNMSRYGFDRDWLSSLLKLGGIVGAIVVGAFLLVNAVSGSFWISAVSVVLAVLLFIIGRKIFSRHKKAVLIASVAVLIAGLLISSIIGRHNHTPRYYRYDDMMYVWFDNDYYLYDYDREDYTLLDDNEVPYGFYSSPDDYQFDPGETADANIPDFTESDSYNTSWTDSIDFFSDGDDDRDYHWDNDNDWDIGGIDWDDDW